MSEDDQWWAELTDNVEQWLADLGTSLWSGWDVSDPKERRPAAEWFVKQCVELECWLLSNGKIEYPDALELGDAGVQPSDQPYPTPASDPGLAESDYERAAYIEQPLYRRAVEGEI